jgi:prephenate dehydratase
MIAVENSTYGRVGDVLATLLPESGLHIVDEAFVRVHINLLGKWGATKQIRSAAGHVVILPSAENFTNSRHCACDQF